MTAPSRRPTDDRAPALPDCGTQQPAPGGSEHCLGDVAPVIELRRN
jgi:hypothetical protein